MAGSSVRAHAGTEGVDVFTTSSIIKLCCTLLSTRSLGIHSPKSRRVFALTFLRPIFPRCGVRSTLTERVYALKRKNLGTRCFLCEILRMSQSTCQGYDLLFYAANGSWALSMENVCPSLAIATSIRASFPISFIMDCIFVIRFTSVLCACMAWNAPLKDNR